MVIQDKELEFLVNLQRLACFDWQEGEPVEVFMADGFPCVRYESGVWWHYDLRRQCWW